MKTKVYATSSVDPIEMVPLVGFNFGRRVVSVFLAEKTRLAAKKKKKKKKLVEKKHRQALLELVRTW